MSIVLPRRVGDCHSATCALNERIGLTHYDAGLNTPRAFSPHGSGDRQRSSSQPPSKSVQFNLDTPDTSSPSSPEHIRRRRQRAGTHDKDRYHDDNIDNEFSSFSDNPSKSHQSNHSASSSSRPHRHHQHRPRRQESAPSASSNPNSSANTLVNPARPPSPAHSDSTIDLPQRFDEKGRKIPERGEDPLADTIESLIGGGGGIGKFMKGFLGGDDDPLGDGGMSRRKKRRD